MRRFILIVSLIAFCLAVVPIAVSRVLPFYFYNGFVPSAEYYDARWYLRGIWLLTALPLFFCSPHRPPLTLRNMFLVPLGFILFAFCFTDASVPVLFAKFANEPVTVDAEVTGIDLWPSRRSRCIADLRVNPLMLWPEVCVSKQFGESLRVGDAVILEGRRFAGIGVMVDRVKSRDPRT